MNEAEFRMITDVAEAAPKELRFNYEELKGYLTQELSAYRTMLVTEDKIGDAKTDRARLNKLAKRIDEYRITVKSQLMAEYDNDFAPKCNELKAMIQEASDNISAQITAYEEREKQAKLERLKAFYETEEGFDEARSYWTWDAVRNARWGNKTYSEDTARGDIRAALEKANGDLEAIRALDWKDVPYLLDAYRECRDISVVLRKAAELNRRRQQEEQLRQQREEQRRRQEEQRRQREEEYKRQEEEKRRTAADSAGRGAETARLTEEKVAAVEFRCYLTKKQLMNLRDFMKSAGIRYERI